MALQPQDGIAAASQACLGTLVHKGGACHLQFHLTIQYVRPFGIERRLALTIARLTGRARKWWSDRDKKHISTAARKVDSSIINQTRLHFEWHEVLLTLASFLMCWGIVFMASRVPRLYGSGQNLKAVQTTHKRPTPRVGGIAIFGTLALSRVLK